jgi:predicted transcriptional regulator
MVSTIPVMTRVTPEVKKKLRAIARSSKRSEAFLAREAIEQFVEVNDWQVELIKGRLAEARAGAEVLSHEEVGRWLDARAAGKNPRVPRGSRRAK